MAMIYGDEDEVVDSTEIRRWYETVTGPKQVFCLEGAGHFFHGRLTEVKQIVQEQIP